MRKSLVAASILLAIVSVAIALAATGDRSSSNEAPVVPKTRTNPEVPSPLFVEKLGDKPDPNAYNAETWVISNFTFHNGEYPDWAGLTSENGAIHLFWKGGKLPANLRTRAEELSKTFPIEIYSTRFSDKDLRAAQEEVSANAFKNGACGSGAPFGSDSLLVDTESDPSSLFAIPQYSSTGVPIVVQKSGCTVAT